MRIWLGSTSGLEGFFKNSVFFNTESSGAGKAPGGRQKLHDHLKLMLEAISTRFIYIFSNSWQQNYHKVVL
ncbi:hypothetical protein A3860_10685 [Niastella vici]|uniref:Uncharacterized protein n=1 Tax=Niastella vici TaxID=1703345 RepID=A0A1V9FFL9_9BACT|nr:hypothetical protein A3860_10685 [Niastella vici]